MAGLALVFPGQGAQYVGMGADLHAAFAPVREWFARAGEILGIDVAELCFQGPQERLDRTANTQIAIVTMEIAIHRLWQAEFGSSRQSLVMAGHSVGEYAALHAAGMIGDADVLSLVRERAMRHDEALPSGTGMMAAIVGLPADRVRSLVDSVPESVGILDLAIVNGPGQVVVSGAVRAVERIMDLARETGVAQAVRLAISVPCHSRLLEEAAGRFRESLDRVSFQDGRVPVIPNCAPDAFHTAGTSAGFLQRQMTSPVRWQETVERMAAMGVDTVVEIGPKRVLSGLIRRIDRRLRLLNVEDLPSWEKTTAAMNSSCQGGTGHDA